MALVVLRGRRAETGPAAWCPLLPQFLPENATGLIGPLKCQHYGDLMDSKSLPYKRFYPAATSS